MASPISFIASNVMKKSSSKVYFIFQAFSWTSSCRSPSIMLDPRYQSVLKIAVATRDEEHLDFCVNITRAESEPFQDRPDFQSRRTVCTLGMELFQTFCDS